MIPKRLSVQEIRKKYPHPVSFLNHRWDGYCVGGALCCSVNGDSKVSRLPSKPLLAAVLRDVNPQLGATSIEEACRIARLNDSSDFEGAWKALDEALNFGRTT